MTNSLLTEIFSVVLGLFTWREENPREQIILAPDVFCIQFFCILLFLFVIVQGTSKGIL